MRHLRGFIDQNSERKIKNLLNKKLPNWESNINYICDVVIDGVDEMDMHPSWIVGVKESSGLIICQTSSEHKGIHLHTEMKRDPVDDGYGYFISVHIGLVTHRLRTESEIKSAHVIFMNMINQCCKTLNMEIDDSSTKMYQKMQINAIGRDWYWNDQMADSLSGFGLFFHEKMVPHK